MVTSTEALSENEETVLTNWAFRVVRDPDPQIARLAKLVLLFWYTGMHPAVLGDRAEYHLETDGKVIRWLRTKTREPIFFPVSPEIAPWVRDFIETFPPMNPVRINQLVHRAGALAGIPELCPRAIRHTVAARLIEKYDFNTAKILTGTTDRVLIRYAKRKAAKAVLAAIATEGF